MTRGTRWSRLAAGTALAGLLGAAPAAAFEEVHWEWNKAVHELVTKEIDIALRLSPSGALGLQDLQISIGDIRASSTVVPGDDGNGGPGDDPNGDDDPNGGDDMNGGDDPGGDPTPLPMDISNVVFYLVDEQGNLVKAIKFDYTQDGIDDGAQPTDLYDTVLVLAGMEGLSVAGYTIKAGQVFYDFGDIPVGATPEDQTDVYASYDYTPSTGDIVLVEKTPSALRTAAAPGPATASLVPSGLNGTLVDPAGLAVAVDTGGAPLDATLHLGAVESAATAVANVVAIDSDVMIEAHETQVAIGGFGEVARDPDAAGAVSAAFEALYAPEAEGYTGNLGVAGAIALMIAGAGGLIEPGLVAADSKVAAVRNVSVDSAATAVANSKTLTLTAATPEDAVLIADATQFAYMDVAATSTVSDVAVHNFTGLGLLTDGSGAARSLVRSVATGVGNNLTVELNAPSPPAGS